MRPTFDPRGLRLLLALMLCGSAACSESGADAPTPDPEPTADAAANGGGEADPGGAPAPGGTPAPGGAPVPGGTPASGGTPEPGGAPEPGGTPESGGAPASVDAGPQPDAAPPEPDAAPFDPDAAPPTPVAEVVLNEVDCTGERWVEVLNTTDAGLDIADWTLVFEGGAGQRNWLIPLGYFLAPRGFLAWPGPREVRAGVRFDFDCEADTVVLLRPDGSEADRFTPRATEANETNGRLPDGGDWQSTAYTRAARNTPPGPRSDLPFDAWHPLRYDVFLSEEARLSLEEAPRMRVDAEVQVTLPDEAEPGPRLSVQLALIGEPGAFRSLAGKASFELTFAPGDLYGAGTVVLDSSVLEPSMLRIWAATEVSRAAGAPVRPVGFGQVTVDGEAYGLYVSSAPADAAARVPGSSVFRGSGGIDLTPLQRDLFTVLQGGRDALRALDPVIGQVAQASRADFAADTAAVLDWAALLPAFAADAWLGRRDGYVYGRRSYVVERPQDGRTRLWPPVSIRVLETLGQVHEGDGFVFRGCMADLTCQGDFDLAMGTLVEGLRGRDLPGDLAALAARMAPWVEADARRPYSALEHTQAAAELGQVLRARTDDVEAQMACRLSADADPDGDGFRCESDCAPRDPNVNPGATDTCGDGLDQDCSGVADDPVGCGDCVERLLGATRYWVCSTPRTWERAAAQCQANGATLVRVESLAESAYLDLQANGVGLASYWTALNDQRTPGRFLNGVDDFSEVEHFQWADAEPRDPIGGRCVVADPATSTWRAIPCNDRAPALCQPSCFTGQDVDLDGADDCALDCDPRDPAIRFEAPEVCGDGVDQDCDAQVDEGQDCDCRVVLLGGQRYGICPTARTQVEARDTCRALTMDLVQLETAGEAVRLAALFDAPRAWVGLFRRFADFTWLNDFPLLWSAWGDAEPAESGECATAGEGLRDWAVTECAAPYPTLCEATCPRPRDVDGDGAPVCGTDCDDSDPNTYSGAPERCGDAMDQDCDGRADEGCP